MLYYSDIGRGEISYKNVSSDETDTIVGVAERKIYSIAASRDYIYYSSWNEKYVVISYHY